MRDFVFRRASACLAGALLCCSLPCGAADSLRLADVLRMALAGNADLRVQQQQVTVARGQQLQAAGQFDTQLSAGVDYARLVDLPPPGYGDQSWAFSSGYQAGVSQQLRNGATLGMSLDAITSFDNSPYATQPPGSNAKLGVTLTLPLLRGAGRTEVTAAEDAARLQVQASRQGLRDHAAQTLYQALSSYWTYSVKLALARVTASSEERARSLLGSTQKLVDSAEKPRADLVLLQADLADKTAARQAAELAVHDARSALGRLLGLDVFAIERLAEPADALPAAAALPAVVAPRLERLRADALAHRPDLRALALQIEAAERQTAAARHQLLPQLDLQLGLSYSKAAIGDQHYAFLDDPGRYQAGPAVTARLSYQFPLQNKSAGGVLMTRSAQLTELTIQQRDLSDGVAAGVDSALQALASNARQLAVAQQALALYEQAVQQEVVKQRNGISTLIDVINVESRFIGARVNYLQTALAYANAVARLRFETGTLVPAGGADDADSFELDVEQLAGLGPLARQLDATP